MTPEAYFPDQFLADAKRFGDSCLCGMTLSQVKDNVDEWPYLEHFLICEYELNLLHQSIHAHFPEDYHTWTQVGVVPHDCLCHHGGFDDHPIRILEYAEQQFPEYKLDTKITQELLMAYDQLFLRYIKDLCDHNSFATLTPEKLMTAMKQDQDNTRAVVQRYLGKKLRT